MSRKKKWERFCRLFIKTILNLARFSNTLRMTIELSHLHTVDVLHRGGSMSHKRLHKHFCWPFGGNIFSFSSSIGIPYENIQRQIIDVLLIRVKRGRGKRCTNELGKLATMKSFESSAGENDLPLKPERHNVKDQLFGIFTTIQRDYCVKMWMFMRESKRASNILDVKESAIDSRIDFRFV